MATRRNVERSITYNDHIPSALDKKRFRDHKAKWSLGLRPSGFSEYDYYMPEFHARVEQGAHLRPIRPASHHGGWKAKFRAHKKGEGVQALHLDLHEALDICSSDDSAADLDLSDWEARAHNKTTPEIFYSFDLKTGPGQGRDVLGHALSRAVERFETKEAEKLEKEYEFVPREGEDDSQYGDGYVADHDEDFEDFEVIGYVRS